jgi:hypothetical protein
MKENIVFLIIGWILGGIMGFFVNLLTDKYKKYQIKKKQKEAEFFSNSLEINYDPMKDDLWEITKWSYKRQLNKENMIVRYKRNRPSQEFIPEDILKKYAQKYKNQNILGDVCYLVNYNIDSQDQDREDLYEFMLEVSPSDYSEHLAAYDYLEENPQIRENIVKILENNPKEYLKKSIPSNISINVVVISELNNILAIKRSSAVASARNEWTIGAFETMVYDFLNTAESDSSFDALARRCLREELGITHRDYKDIFISWMGLSLLSMRGHVIAVVRLQKTTEAQMEGNMKKAHGYYEASIIKWLPMDVIEIKSFVERHEGNYMEYIKEYGGKWSSFAPLALTEALRVKDYMSFVKPD